MLNNLLQLCVIVNKFYFKKQFYHKLVILFLKTGVKHNEDLHDYIYYLEERQNFPVYYMSL